MIWALFWIGIFALSCWFVWWWSEVYMARVHMRQALKQMRAVYGPERADALMAEWTKEREEANKKTS